MPDHTQQANLAETLARVLPKAEAIGEDTVGDAVVRRHFAVPQGFKLEVIDSQKLQPRPLRTEAKVALVTVESFLDYVKRHAGADSVIWAQFDPQAKTLAFQLVVDEHNRATPGWGSHQAVYAPAWSHEWKVWMQHDGKAMSQVDFAGFLERNADDINADGEGLPTSLAMLAMATEFEASSEKRVRSVTRLQSGGVRLEFVDDDDEATVSQMRAFDRFQIGVPVFWAGLAFRLQARLKYRVASGKVTFWYELIRPDVVYEAAARALIDTVRTGSNGTPLLFGSR